MRAASGGVLEGFPDALDIRVPDVPDHAEVSEASGDRTPRDAVSRVQACDDRARHLEEGVRSSQMNFL